MVYIKQTYNLAEAAEVSDFPGGRNKLARFLKDRQILGEDLTPTPLFTQLQLGTFEANSYGGRVRTHVLFNKRGVEFINELYHASLKQEELDDMAQYLQKLGDDPDYSVSGVLDALADTEFCWIQRNDDLPEHELRQEWVLLKRGERMPSDEAEGPKYRIGGNEGCTLIEKAIAGEINITLLSSAEKRAALDRGSFRKAARGLQRRWRDRGYTHLSYCETADGDQFCMLQDARYLPKLHFTVREQIALDAEPALDLIAAALEDPIFTIDDGRVVVRELKRELFS